MSDKLKGKKWDGKSRLPDDSYRKNWEEIFGTKKEKESDDEHEDYLKSLKNM